MHGEQTYFSGSLILDSNFQGKNMTPTRIKPLFLLTLASMCFHCFAGAPARISVNVAKPGHEIPKTLWGVFFEDINLSADGGIYPELVKNRSFEDYDKPEGWEFRSSDGKST